ncbi:MAG: PGPGW domain-containing protein [Clostridia bacterium]|jgi:uncharacterized membrane protein YbaN (DUF454 family)|nr:PGPGW domain-containing protein [Clostridia bacterium]
MNKNIKDLGIIVLGWAFVFLGIIGLFLPVLQGFLFLLIGLYLLSKKSVLARKIQAEIRRRIPRLSDKLELARWKGERLLQKIKIRFRRPRK